MAIEIIQQNTGSFEGVDGSTGSVTLLSGTTAGSFIVIAATIDGDSNFWDLFVGESGTPDANVWEFGGDNSGIRRVRPYLFGKRNIGGSETTWTLNITGEASPTRRVVWAVFELSGAGLDPYGTTSLIGTWTDQPTSINGSESAVATVSTGTTQGNPCYDTLSFAVHASGRSDSTVPTISAHTNNYAEVASVDRSSGGLTLKMSVSTLQQHNVGTTESTASISPSSAAYATVGTIFADGARFAKDIQVMTGFEVGTAASLNVGSVFQAGTAVFDGVVGSPAVTTSHPRSGTYCLQLTSSAAAECVTWTAAAGGLLGVPENIVGLAIPVRFNVYFEDLPTADVELFSIEAGSLANGVVGWFRQASGKIGIKIGTGTEQLSDAVVAADQWIGIDVRYDPRTTTHTCDWQVDYNSNVGDTTGPVAQTRATTAAMTAGDVTTIRIGWSVSRTATVFYDDILVGRGWGNYPIGDCEIVLAKVDPAGTPTISGSSANFRTYTSNGGTLTAWTAANTRTVLGDVPAVIGASSDGLTQITAASGDYCEIPMETVTCAPDYCPVAVRWYALGWAASGTAATAGMEFWDTGGSSVRLLAVGDHGWDNAIVSWITTMHRAGGRWYQITQARLDGLKCRFGYSGDATPDVGIHMVCCEVAKLPVVEFHVSEVEDGAFGVYVRQDPVSGAVISYLVHTPSGTRGATFTYALSGVDQTPVYTNPDSTQEISIGADDIALVTGTHFVPDPA